MSGNYTAEFESWLAKKNHVRYAVTCHSGTQALEIIARYSRQCIEDHVSHHAVAAIPTMTYPATANALVNAGWDLKFIDVDRYGLINFDHLMGTAVSHLLIMVGLFGAAVENPSSNQGWAQRLAMRSMTVIEDAAQHWLSNDCARIGNAAAVSFDPTKNLNNFGNGGAVLTNDRDLYFYAVSWRNNGKSDHEVFGTNSRMSEIDCAQMMIKTAHLDAWQARRRQIAEFWIMKFRAANLRCLIDPKNFDDHCFHKFVVELDHRDTVANYLSALGIETRVHYDRPLHEIGAFRQFPGPNMLSVGSSLCRRVLSLPFYPELTDLEVEYIADQLISCVSRAGTDLTTATQNSV